MSTDARILEAAMRVLREEGLGGATTRRIADEAGVNEVTLFRRFGTKDQVLVAAIHHEAAAKPAWLPESPEDPERELFAWWVQISTEMHRSRQLIRSTLPARETHAEFCSAAHMRPREQATELARYLRHLVDAGLASPDLPVASAVRMCMGALFSELVADPMFDETAPFSADEMASRYVPLLLRAIGALPRPERGSI